MNARQRAVGGLSYRPGRGGHERGRAGVAGRLRPGRQRAGPPRPALRLRRAAGARRRRAARRAGQGPVRRSPRGRVPARAHRGQRERADVGAPARRRQSRAGADAGRRGAGPRRRRPLGAPVADVLRLAVPPRHGRVEAGAPGPPPEPVPAPSAAGWEGPGRASAARGARSRRRAPRRLDGPARPHLAGELAAAAHATAASGPRRACWWCRTPATSTAWWRSSATSARGADRAGRDRQARYRAWLRVLRGGVRVVVGHPAAAWAPVRDLGLVAVWDDGDDLHDEPRAPYRRCVTCWPCARTARARLPARRACAHRRGAAAVRTGLGPRPGADRPTCGAAAPRSGHLRGADVARDPRARAARLPPRPSPWPGTALGGPPCSSRCRAPGTPRRWPALAAALPARCPSAPVRSPRRRRPRPPAAGAARPQPGAARPARRRGCGPSSWAPPHGRGARAGLPGTRCSPSGRDAVLAQVPDAPGAGTARQAPSPWPTGATPQLCCSTAGSCSGGPICARRRRRCAAGWPPRPCAGRRPAAAPWWWAPTPPCPPSRRWCGGTPSTFAERELEERAALRLPAGGADGRGRRVAGGGARAGRGRRPARVCRGAGPGAARRGGAAARQGAAPRRAGARRRSGGLPAPSAARPRRRPSGWSWTRAHPPETPRGRAPSRVYGLGRLALR